MPKNAFVTVDIVFEHNANLSPLKVPNEVKPSKVHFSHGVADSLELRLLSNERHAQKALRRVTLRALHMCTEEAAFEPMFTAAGFVE